MGECEGQRPRLFTIANPVSKSKLPSFLQLWDTSSFLLIKSVAHVASPISNLATSPCGKFVATGSMFGGFVDIYTSYNLQVLLTFSFLFFFLIHNFLVTDCQTRRKCPSELHYGSSLCSLPHGGWTEYYRNERGSRYQHICG